MAFRRKREEPTDQAVDFCVRGFSATLYRHPAPPPLLQSWAGDVCVTIDRFDARQLLSSVHQPAKRFSASDDTSPELEEERWKDLRALKVARRRLAAEAALSAAAEAAAAAASSAHASAHADAATEVPLPGAMRPAQAKLVPRRASCTRLRDRAAFPLSLSAPLSLFTAGGVELLRGPRSDVL